MKSLQIISLIALLVITHAYMEFELQRNPHRTKKLALIKSQCQDPKTVDKETQYLELCFEKDIAYTFEFLKNGKKYYLGLDMTTPISWIKDDKCKLSDTTQRCSLIQESLNEKLHGVVKQKITNLMGKLKMKMADDEESNTAIIEGSNEIIMGEVQPEKNMSIVAHNTDHLSKFVDLLLLGLYIIGQNDNFTLNTTTFISAHQITPNLNTLEDGAVSLRFDDNSQNSFLNEAFDYMKTKEKIISIYLSKEKNVVTIGGMSPKYSEIGISGFTRMKIEQDDHYGKLPRMQGIILENADIDDNTLQIDSLVIITLSASYIGFSKENLQKFIDKFLPKSLNCKIDNEAYLECTVADKKLMKQFSESSLNIDFDTSIISFSVKSLILKNQNKKITFNIKQTPNNYTIIGEPFFMSYYTYFDYGKNEIGVAPRKLSVKEHLVNAVSMIHFVVILMLLGFCFLCVSDPCKRIALQLFEKVSEKVQEGVKKGFQAYKRVSTDNSDDSSRNQGYNNNHQQLEDQVEGI